MSRRKSLDEEMADLVTMMAVADFNRETESRRRAMFEVKDQEGVEKVSMAAAAVALVGQGCCPSCNALHPAFDRATAGLSSRAVTVAYVDAMAAELPESWDVMSVPQVLFLRSGEVAMRLEGVVTEGAIRAGVEAMGW